MEVQGNVHINTCWCARARSGQVFGMQNRAGDGVV
jgi:hypothetical protein